MSNKSQTSVPRIGDVHRPTELLREFIQLSRRFERKIESLTSVNPTDRVVMETLLQRGPSTPGELAVAAEITPAAMTASIDRLIELNHVRRDQHPSDRRKLLITASERSSELIMGELREMIMDVDSSLRDFNDDELEIIMRFLNSVNAAYARHVEPEG